MSQQRITCPVCSKEVDISSINQHLDAGCPEEPPVVAVAAAAAATQPAPAAVVTNTVPAAAPSTPVSSFFASASAKNKGLKSGAGGLGSSPIAPKETSSSGPNPFASMMVSSQSQGNSQQKRTLPLPFQRERGGGDRRRTSGDEQEHAGGNFDGDEDENEDSPAAKRLKTAVRAGTGGAASVRASTMPLAERVRPTNLDHIQGQDLVGPGGILRRMIENDQVKSMILWGGPGCGKTTIARTIAAMTKARFVELSATLNSVADCKKIFDQAKGEAAFGRRTIVFVDEIHRFSKTQQDVFLSPVESGQVILIGATTENPSFKVQSALLSRCRVFALKPLSTESTLKILTRALSTEFPDHTAIPSLLDASLLTYLAEFASGDARTALNLLEISIQLSSEHTTQERGASVSDEEPIESKDVSKVFTQDDLKKALTRTLVYDRQGDGHYDTISAFHKSVRGNDPDAALYYLGRMIESGEDPLFISRRMMVIASEDVGLADNTLLSLATATHFAVQNVGMPEARINLAHCTVALCLAKKSTRAYRGLGNVMSLLQSDPAAASAPIPLHLRNAPTKLMKNMGYGKEYKYPPSYVDGLVKQEYMPEMLRGKKFLEETDMGTKIDEELEEEGGGTLFDEDDLREVLEY